MGGALALLFAASPRATAEAGSAPDDTLLLKDVMRLIGMDLGTLKREAGRIGQDELAGEKALNAARDAQRYLRVAVRRWAPDRGFRDFANASMEAWARTEDAVRTGNAAAVKDTLAPLGTTCKACHDVYDRDE